MSVSARAVTTVTVLALLAACSRGEGTASPPGAGAGAAGSAQTVSASGGEVARPEGAAAAPAEGMTGLTDSISVAADRGRIKGAPGAKVWVIEISDFQCPYCKQWHDSTYPALDRDFIQSGKARLAYLNLPLSSIHPNAQGAAEAAMCSSAQGKFWEMHDALFDGQAAWGRATDPMPAFTAMARKSGVNEAAWTSCMTTHATAALIAADRDRVTSRGIRSTPSFFIGSQRIEGVVSYPPFKAAIEQQLGAATPR